MRQIHVSGEVEEISVVANLHLRLSAEIRVQNRKMEDDDVASAKDAKGPNCAAQEAQGRYALASMVLR